MADGEIDGFTAFRAARKANAAPKGEGPPVRAAAEGKTKRGEAPGSRIGRTAMPTGKAIVCYYCEHAFEIVGAQANTMCPGCKEWLDVKDVTVNRGNWSQDIVTAGSLVVNSQGVVTGGIVVANRIVLKGKIEGGEIYATHQLEVHKNALLNLEHVTARDLVIQKGASFEVDEGLLDRFHNIELHGSLSGIIRPTGKLTIHPNGYFTGTVEAASVDVKPGGELAASCRLTGELRAPAIRNKPKVPKRSKTSNTPAAKKAAAKRKANTSSAASRKAVAEKAAKEEKAKAAKGNATPETKAEPGSSSANAEASKPSVKKVASSKPAEKVEKANPATKPKPVAKAKPVETKPEPVIPETDVAAPKTAKTPAAPPAAEPATTLESPPTETKPATKKKAAAKKAAAKKTPTAKKTTAKKKSSKTVPTKKTASKKKSSKAVPTKKTAKKKSSKAVPTKKTARKKAPTKKAPPEE